MNKLFAIPPLISLLMTSLPLVADEKPANVVAAADAIKVEGKFDAKFCIAPRVAKLGPPKFQLEAAVPSMMVATNSELAQKHVEHGFALVSAQWDFEAYRHFAAAIQQDPECLMAYAGMCLALARPFNEDLAYRNVAMERMLDLVEAVDELNEAVFPDYECRFATAVATLLVDSPRKAGEMFYRIADFYPNESLARLFGIFLLRGGYDEFGDARPTQVAAIKDMKALMEKNPDDLMIIEYYLALVAESPASMAEFEKQYLPYARKLAEINPEFAPWQHLLGHFLWRSGKLAEADKAFANSSRLFKEYRKAQGVSFFDCQTELKSYLYRSSCLYDMGKFDLAIKLASPISKLNISEDRLASATAQMVLWDARTLPARMYIGRGQPGDYQKALETLPKKGDKQIFGEKSLAGGYVEALAYYCGAHKALAAKDYPAAKGIHQAFRGMISKIASMEQSVRFTNNFSSLSEFHRAGSTLAVLDMCLAGQIALEANDDSKLAAINWLRSAADRQSRPSMMMPSSISTPMENLIGEAYLELGEVEKARDAFAKAIELYPNNYRSAAGLKQCEGQAK